MYMYMCVQTLTLRGPPFKAGLGAQQSKHSQRPHLLVLIKIVMLNRTSSIVHPILVPHNKGGGVYY